MTDLRVIEGGGGDGNIETVHDRIAAANFHSFSREFLRLLAGGGDAHAVGMSMVQFIDHCADHEVRFVDVIDAAVADMRRQICDMSGKEPHVVEEMMALEPALRLITEYLADDNAAAARRSKRSREFRERIDQTILSSERRSREAGWSHLENLSKRLGKWKPPKK